MQLSGGPFTYNRFNDYEALLEGSKPDFLDMDKDGDKEEPMKKAIKEKGKKSPCEKCKDEGKDDCNCDGDKKAKKDKAMKNIKEAFTDEEVLDARLSQIILESGIANNEISAKVIANSMSDQWAAHLLENYEG